MGAPLTRASDTFAVLNQIQERHLVSDVQLRKALDLPLATVRAATALLRRSGLIEGDYNDLWTPVSSVSERHALSVLLAAQEGDLGESVDARLLGLLTELHLLTPTGAAYELTHAGLSLVAIETTPMPSGPVVRASPVLPPGFPR